MVAIGSFSVTSGCVGGWLSWHGRVKELGTGKAPRGAVRCARHAGKVTSKDTTPQAAHDHRIAAKPRPSGIKALLLPLEVWQIICARIRGADFGVRI